MAGPLSGHLSSTDCVYKLHRRGAFIAQKAEQGGRLSRVLSLPADVLDLIVRDRLRGAWMDPKIQRVVETHRAEIDELCRRYGVRRLELFGSAMSARFDPHLSDIDVLVEFAELDDRRYADAYFGLAAALEALLGRTVDLVVTSAVTNPYFLEDIAPSRTLLHAA
jgi:predicted nucleotidyltransferase